jgi:hypothetical protein
VDGAVQGGSRKRSVPAKSNAVTSAVDQMECDVFFSSMSLANYRSHECDGVPDLA